MAALVEFVNSDANRARASSSSPTGARTATPSSRSWRVLRVHGRRRLAGQRRGRRPRRIHRRVGHRAAGPLSDHPAQGGPDGREASLDEAGPSSPPSPTTSPTTSPPRPPAPPPTRRPPRPLRFPLLNTRARQTLLAHVRQPLRAGDRIRRRRAAQRRHPAASVARLTRHAREDGGHPLSRACAHAAAAPAHQTLPTTRRTRPAAPSPPDAAAPEGGSRMPHASRGSRRVHATRLATRQVVAMHPLRHAVPRADCHAHRRLARFVPENQHAIRLARPRLWRRERGGRRGRTCA